MRVAFFLATFFAASVSVFASAASIVSPDHPQTFAYGEMIWNQLYLQRAGGELAARITFSNLPYAGDDEPRRDESFDFRFPGIKFDPTRRTFFVSGRGGKMIPVARFRGDPFCSWVDLAPGAKIYLLKQSGRVTAILTATDSPPRRQPVDRDGRQFFVAEYFGCAIRPACSWPPIDLRIEFRRGRVCV